jgi:hypothetical protein
MGSCLACGRVGERGGGRNGDCLVLAGGCLAVCLSRDVVDESSRES